MPDNDYLRQTLTHYREQRQRMLEQLRPIDLMIRTIEAELGEAPDAAILPDLMQAFSPDVNAGRITPPAGQQKSAEIRADEFFGKSQGEAARAYLNKVGHAVEVPELVAALNKGGCRVGGADPERTLYIALIRNTKDFVKVPNGFIGLRSMYPNLKPGAASAGKPKDKARKGGKRKSGKKKVGAKASAKRASKQAAGSPEPETPPAKQSAPVKATVKEVLAGGDLMSGAEIVQKVQEKIETAKSFTVYGILKNEKDFEKVGEQFRLRSAVKEEAQATAT